MPDYLQHSDGSWSRIIDDGKELIPWTPPPPKPRGRPRKPPTPNQRPPFIPNMIRKCIICERPTQKPTQRLCGNPACFTELVKHGAKRI